MKYFKVNLAEIPNNDTDVRKITAVNDDLVKIINKATKEMKDWDGMYNIKDAQKRFNEYDSSVAMKMAERADTKSRAESILNRRKAGISLLKQQIKDRDIKGLLNRTPTGKFIQGFGSMFKRATGTSVGETLQSKARDLNLAFRKSGGFENIQDKFREAKAIARGKPSERLLNNLGFFAGAGGKPEETFGSQTSGRFGQFVAAASLGSGKGRRISQARGIRIQGLDKSVLIQEDTKKLLEQLVERTRER